MERIVVQNASKKFNIGFHKQQGALARFVSAISGKDEKKSFWVLKKVSFSANQGEIIGIIGKNGSGKSTLLRVIAGIYSIDKGSIKINGNIISLIGLGAGLKERLTMRENIFLCCLLFGLDQTKIKKRFNQIVEFSELEKYINTKIYQFSEGMKERLIFSIATQCNPDIMLLDEIFAVGDDSFRIKSLNKIKDLVKNGTTILLTTHYLQSIEEQIGRNFDKAIWMDNGKIIEYGNSKAVMIKYLKDQ